MFEGNLKIYWIDVCLPNGKALVSAKFRDLDYNGRSVQFLVAANSMRIHDDFSFGNTGDGVDSMAEKLDTIIFDRKMKSDKEIILDTLMELFRNATFIIKDKLRS